MDVFRKILKPLPNHPLWDYALNPEIQRFVQRFVVESGQGFPTPLK